MQQDKSGIYCGASPAQRNSLCSSFVAANRGVLALVLPSLARKREQAFFPLASLDNKNSLLWALGGLLLALVLIVRLLFFGTATSDYIYFVAQWFDTLKSHQGLTAFLYPFSDYAPLYLYALKFLTLFPVPALYSIKTLTLTCDGILAGIAYVFLRYARPEWSAARTFFSAVIIFSIPTVIVNSSLWGQSDVLYAMSVMAALYFIMRDEPLYAALAFGVAFSTKLQAIFFLPILAGYLLRKKITAPYLLLPALVYIVSIIPAWMGGGSPRDLLLVYIKESKEYTSLAVSGQSAFAFVSNAIPLATTNALFWFGIILAGLCSAALAYSVYAKQEMSTERLVQISLLCVLLLPYLLPRMHERYFYLADVFSVLYALYSPRAWYIPVLIVTSSLLSYMPYLSSQVSWLSSIHVDLRIPSAMLLISIGILLFQICFLRSRLPASVQRRLIL